MKFNIAKGELSDVLNIVSKGMSSRSTLPILSGILIDAEPGKVTFQTTDLEISIRHHVAADVQEPGKTVIPGKLFSDIVKSLPDAAVTVSANQDQAEISCMDSSFSLSTLNPIDFPYFPEVSPSMTITLPTDVLANNVHKVSKAVSRDEARAILTGILFSVENSEVHLAATDSYRLAVADIQVDDQTFDPFQAIIPGRIFEDIARLSTNAPDIQIGFSDNQIIFLFGDTVFVSRKIEGTYPNYKQLISTEKNVIIRIDSSAFATAIKRVSLLAQAHTPIRFAFSSEDQNVTITSRTQDIGGAKEVVPAQVEGDDITIAFNHQYILDGLSAISDEVLIELQTALKPGIFKAADDDRYLYLAMPVRLS